MDGPDKKNGEKRDSLRHRIESGGGSPVFGAELVRGRGDLNAIAIMCNEYELHCHFLTPGAESVPGRLTSPFDFPGKKSNTGG